jgi:hypothetical protein
MKKIFFPLIAVAFSLGIASCTDDKKDNHLGEEAKGGVYLGGVLRLNEVEAFKSFKSNCRKRNLWFSYWLPVI